MDDAAYSAESGVFPAAVNPDPSLSVPVDWYAKRRGVLENKLAGLSFPQSHSNLSVDSKADPSEISAQVDLQTHAPGGESGIKNSGSPPAAMSGNVLRLLQQSSKSNLF